MPNLAVNMGRCRCGCCAADVQIVVAQLKRVGLGIFIYDERLAEGFIDGNDDTNNPSFYHITGPFSPPDNPPPYPPLPLPTPWTNPTIDPLYLDYVSNQEWTSGVLAQQTVIYDATNQDMTVTETCSWDSAANNSTQTNIPAAAPNLYVPSVPDPPSGFTYAQDYTNQPFTVTYAPTQLIISYPEYNDGTLTHYGYKQTQILSNPFTYSQYAAICDGFLDQVALLNTSAIYSVVFPAYSTFNVNFVYASAMTKTSGGIPNNTNQICVSFSRAGYTLTAAFSPTSYPAPGWYFTIDHCGANGIVSGGQFPLCATGLSFTITNATAPTPTGSPDNCAYVYSVKSAIKTAQNLSLTAEQRVFNPATNSFSVIAVPSAPSASGEYIFDPTEISGFGYLMAYYNSPSQISAITVPWLDLFSMIQTGDSIAVGFGRFLARGQVITYYSISADADGNFIKSVPATWTLKNSSGVDGTLVVASDGKSATYTAPNVAGITYILVSAAGLTTAATGAQVTE